MPRVEVAESMLPSYHDPHAVRLQDDALTIGLPCHSPDVQKGTRGARPFTSMLRPVLTRVRVRSCIQVGGCLVSCESLVHFDLHGLME